ncbi:MAG: YwiC-like family protein [candidate division NC10 bacterium]|nr:YwiC-like family protein [candidate division NC10 bacterium]
MLGRPIIPKEHGAWAVLYGSFLAGIGVAGQVTLPVALLFVAVTAAALGNGPLTILVRPAAGRAWEAERRRAWFWLSLYGTPFILSTLPLFLIYRLTFLTAFGLGAGCFLLFRASLVRGRDDRSLPGELVGTAGLSMVGPAAHAVAARTVEPTAALLWLLLFLFFASGVFYVRMRIRGMLARRQGVAPERQAAFWSCLAYHLALLVGMPLLAAIHLVPWTILLAFAPALWRAAAGLRRHQARLDLKGLGWSEVAQTLAFLVLLIASLRLPAPPG